MNMNIYILNIYAVRTVFAVWIENWIKYLWFGVACKKLVFFYNEYKWEQATKKNNFKVTHMQRGLGEFEKKKLKLKICFSFLNRRSLTPALTILVIHNLIWTFGAFRSKQFVPCSLSNSHRLEMDFTMATIFFLFLHQWTSFCICRMLKIINSHHNHRSINNDVRLIEAFTEKLCYYIVMIRIMLPNVYDFLATLTFCFVSVRVKLIKVCKGFRMTFSDSMAFMFLCRRLWDTNKMLLFLLQISLDS